MKTPDTPDPFTPITDEAIKKFKGQIPELERAIGMLYLGRQLGWKVIYLSHSKSTIRKYERILGIKVREAFPEVGPLAHKSIGWEIAKTVSNFWKEVTGNLHGSRSKEVT